MATCCPGYGVIGKCCCIAAAANPDRGTMINRRAYLGSQIVQLRTRIPEVEKLSRSTPPKTLAAERLRVWQAKQDLPLLKAQLAAMEPEWKELKKKLGESDWTPWDNEVTD